MNKIGIIITTFLKDEALKSCIDAVLKFSPKQEYIVLIGDQNPTHIKELNYNYLPNCIYNPLPYDFGLSASRNYLVKEAKDLKCDYILLMADNIQFIAKYDFQPIINFLESDKNNGLVSFDIDYAWHYAMKIENGEFVFSDIIEPYIFEGIIYHRYDIVPNFWLGKTEVILQNLWDEKLKMTEHEDFMWRLKTQTPYKAFATGLVKAKRIVDRTGKYKEMRQRHLTDEFRDIVRQKWGLTGWIRLPR